MALSLAVNSKSENVWLQENESVCQLESEVAAALSDLTLRNHGKVPLQRGDVLEMRCDSFPGYGRLGPKAGPEWSRSSFPERS
jgi:hypothetical protein